MARSTDIGKMTGKKKDVSGGLLPAVIKLG
jgi:hypothetical protein